MSTGAKRWPALALSIRTSAGPPRARSVHTVRDRHSCCPQAWQLPLVWTWLVRQIGHCGGLSSGINGGLAKRLYAFARCAMAAGSARIAMAQLAFVRAVADLSPL